MRLRVMAVAAGQAGLAGCVKEAPADGGAVFGFEPWVPASVLVGGLALLAAGAVLVARRRWLYGLGAGLFGLVMAVIVGPDLWTDRAVVTDDRFELSTGFWFAPTRHAVRWDEVRSLEGVAEEKSGRRGRKSTSFSVVFRKKAGGQEQVPVGDLMKRGPYRRLLEVADRKGIPISGVGPEGVQD